MASNRDKLTKDGDSNAVVPSFSSARQQSPLSSRQLFQVDMVRKPGALAPAPPPPPHSTNIFITADNKVWCSGLLFWCDAIVVWANSSGLYKRKCSHLKCQTAAVAEAQEFPVSGGCFSFSCSRSTPSTCGEQRAVSNVTHFLTLFFLHKLKCYSFCPVVSSFPSFIFDTCFKLKLNLPFY